MIPLYFIDIILIVHNKYNPLTSVAVLQKYPLCFAGYYHMFLIPSLLHSAFFESIGAVGPLDRIS